MLDKCHDINDVKSAMRIMNMANTFHSQDNDLSSRIYLSKERDISKHPIWLGQGFWESSLMERLSTELQFQPPVNWDDLSQELLRETVVSIHNVVFGQLGTIAFNMHELGLSFEEVQNTILDLSRKFQLVEDQEHELMKLIRNSFNIPLNEAEIIQRKEI